VKSSLSKARQRVSFEFFKERFYELVDQANDLRRTYRGFYIYAIDGQETTIPLSEQILEVGFRGRARAHDMETYYPRLYVSALLDVVNEFVVGVRPTAERNENNDAKELLEKTERNSIVLYDRAYICKALLRAHQDKGNYFIFRCQRGGTLKTIIEFYKSGAPRMTWEYEGMRIRLIRYKNPKTQEDMVFATNLSEEQFSDEEVACLYARRWGVETSFRDSVTQALEQWHAKTPNGILQEFYAHFWLMNIARIQLMAERREDPTDWLQPEYKKSNLKLVIETLVLNLKLIVARKFTLLIKRLNQVIRRTIEKRVHLKRSYLRVRKYSRKSFTYNNLVQRRGP